MTTMRWRRYAWVLTAVAGLCWVAGCGGGGSGGGGASQDSGATVGDPFADLQYTPPGFQPTAHFGVNVATGDVDVTAGGASGAGRAILGGTVVDFDSSLMFDQPGDTGLKVLRVALINRSGLTMGQTADGSLVGLRVLFSSFRPLSGADLDLRDKASVSTAAGTGALAWVDGRASEASFQGPAGVATSPDGAVYVTDFAGNRVRKIQDGQVFTLVGNGAHGGTDGSGTAATLGGPLGLANNPSDGSIVVCDATGHRIRRITPDGVVTTICGNGTATSADGAGDVALCRNPTAVAVSPQGQIYFTEGSGHRVRTIDYTGGFEESDRQLASNYQVTTLAGSGTGGFAEGTGSSAAFNNPLGVACDGDGNVYVADTGNRRVRRVSPTGQVVTIAGTGVDGSGDGSGEVATFSNPSGICWTAQGLVITDRAAHLVRLCSLRSPNAAGGAATSWIVRRLAGSGSSGIVDGPGNTARFSAPFGIAADVSGNLYLGTTPTTACGRSPSTLAHSRSANRWRFDIRPVLLWNADGVLPSSGFGSSTPYVLYPESLANGDSSQPKEWWFSIPPGSVR